MSGENSSSHTTQEIGRTLERARRERGLSLEDVEQATKIRVRYLRDLENENFDVLPAVYMLGSLKTYARYLGLDEGAMTREFKHRQALLQEKENASQEEPQPDETHGLFAALGRLLGVGGFERGEDEAGTVPDPGHSPRLYMSLGVVMIFVFFVALASNIRADDRPTISQVHETKVSKFPSMIALSGTLGDERNTGDEKRDDQAENGTESSAKDADKDKKDGSERGENNAPLTARASSGTASASVDASAASSGSASAVAMAQAGSKSERATAGISEDADRGVAADASAGPSAHAHAGPVMRRKQAGPTGATRLRNRITSQAWSAVDDAW
jgi:cytoskeletal protein RodZ